MTQQSLIESIPQPIVPGREMGAIRRFHRDGTWTGTIHAGGMGPGTPMQVASGRARHRWIQDGTWLVGDYEQDQLLRDGTHVLTWKLHWVCGWDPAAGAYKATLVDNFGRADLLSGRVVGDSMIFTSVGPEPPIQRVTREAMLGGPILWRSEMSRDGASWIRIEDHEIIPSD